MTSDLWNSARTVSLLLLLSLLVLMGAGLLTDTAAAADSPKARIAAEKAKIPFPKPESHSANWAEYHGRSVEPGMTAAGSMADPCLTCHQKTDCISCHLSRAPRDHTNTWRTLSHGFTAEGNRERCLTCHKQDYCVRCHNETAPRSHVANWKSRHCSWCHFSSGTTPEESCNICHKKALHTSAPHGPQSVCTPCHQ